MSENASPSHLVLISVKFVNCLSNVFGCVFHRSLKMYLPGKLSVSQTDARKVPADRATEIKECSLSWDTLWHQLNSVTSSLHRMMKDNNGSNVGFEGLLIKLHGPTLCRKLTPTKMRGVGLQRLKQRTKATISKLQNFSRWKSSWSWLQSKSIQTFNSGDM